jgi:hypothetical protein
MAERHCAHIGFPRHSATPTHPDVVVVVVAVIVVVMVMEGLSCVE